VADERIDIISPTTLGEDKIKITLSPLSDPAFVESPITVDFDYSEADEEGGLRFPINVEVIPAFGDGTGYQREEFRRSRPSSFSFRAAGAGEHLILIKESAHNKWQGRLLIDVEGEEFTQIPVGERN
jgi:hypothetical protein